MSCLLHFKEFLDECAGVCAITWLRKRILPYNVALYLAEVFVFFFLPQIPLRGCAVSVQHLLAALPAQTTLLMDG